MSTPTLTIRTIAAHGQSPTMHLKPSAPPLPPAPLPLRKTRQKPVAPRLKPLFRGIQRTTLQLRPSPGPSY